MIFLILSVLCVAAFSLFFKFFERFQLNVFQTIVFNYWVAFLCGLPFLNDHSLIQISSERWFWVAVGLGLCFITVFNFFGQTVKHFGVSTATVSMKLSLVFPVAFAFLVYGEDYNYLKLTGIGFAFIALLLTTYRKQESHHTHSNTAYLLPFLVFIGSGLCDSVVQFANKSLLKESDVASFVSMNFLSAALAGSVVMFFRYFKDDSKVEWKNLLGGTLIGIPNYFSFLFLLLALENLAWGSGVIFPISNISTIAVSALSAFVIFQEKSSFINLIGLSFATISIILIALSNY